ncbi:Endonuclease YncB, thermonuclease family [Phyllobacterium sp. CL33Tsu]|uniref:thermonuclease family protein n=1 Tax=Phyllobacterium sp. CL33Tsu TaxID=1798191 RepID=UPI0008E0D871|nr:thermonuclease family protein [Phyllobacterium sp. CL33Tsu]SFI61357.1 Endonuclease YncB, thermonuclease family [Phyllobacterium sp. CL33Tsu]
MGKPVGLIRMRQLPLYILTVLVALTLVYAFVAPFNGALETARPASGDEPTVTTENFELPAEMQDAQSDGASPAPDEPKAARTVKPDLMSPSIGDATPLQRVAPRQPLSELGQALPPKPPAPPEPPPSLTPPPPPVPVDDTAKPTLLYRPVAIAAGSLEVSGYRITLDGIEEIKPNETCTSEGTTWPCGMAARTAFRNWLRQRAVECDVPGQPPEAVLATHCRLGGVDLAQWLVENGWARTPDGSPQSETMKKAQEAKLGIFGSPPPALPITQELPVPALQDNLPPEELAAPAVLAPLPVPDAPFPPPPQQ